MRRSTPRLVALSAVVVALPGAAALVLVLGSGNRAEPAAIARPAASPVAGARAGVGVPAPARGVAAAPAPTPASAVEAAPTAPPVDAPASGARAVLAALRAATDDEAASELARRLVAELDPAALADVARELQSIAEGDAEPFRRAAAVAALGELPFPDVARVERVASVARRDRDEGVRQMAAYALGQLGDRAPGEVSARAASELVAALADESSGAVRTGRLSSVRDTRDARVVDAIVLALGGDQEPAARQAAADQLGGVAAAHRDRALDALARRFDAETDPDLRLTVITSIIRAGGESATARLEALRARAGAQARDVDDYLEGLRQGETDMDRLYAWKQQRELARGEAPGGAHAAHEHAE